MSLSFFFCFVSWLCAIVDKLCNTVSEKPTVERLGAMSRHVKQIYCISFVMFFKLFQTCSRSFCLGEK